MWVTDTAIAIAPVEISKEEDSGRVNYRNY
jgi:hypothetical protein